MKLSLHSRIDTAKECNMIRTASARLSCQLLNLIFLIWIFMGAFSVSDGEQCDYTKSCTPNYIQILEATNASDWENCNMRRQCTNVNDQGQSGKFECLCTSKVRASFQSICGKTNTRYGTPGLEKIYIRNDDNYPEKNSQPDECECVVNFNSSGGFPNVSLSHIDLPGSDEAVYVTDGTIRRTKSDCPPDSNNCELSVKKMDKKTGQMKVVAEARNKTGRFWIKVSSGQSMSVTCRVKKTTPNTNGVTAKITTLATTTRQRGEPEKTSSNRFVGVTTELTSSKTSPQMTTTMQTEKMHETPNKFAGTTELTSTSSTTTKRMLETPYSSSVTTACLAVAGVIAVVMVIICTIWWRRRAKRATEEEAVKLNNQRLHQMEIVHDNYAADTQTQDGTIMKENDIYQSAGFITGPPMKDNDIYESSGVRSVKKQNDIYASCGSINGNTNVGPPMKDNNIYESSGSLFGNKNVEPPMKDNSIYESSGSFIGNKNVGPPMKDNSIYESSGSFIGDKIAGPPMKDNDIYESSGSLIGDKNVEPPMKDNDIYESSGSLIGDKNIEPPMKDNDIYQSSGSLIGNKNVGYPMKDNDIYESSKSIMKENDIYQTSDMHAQIEQTNGAPVFGSAIYEMERKPKDLGDGLRDVRAGYGYPFGENPYELEGDQWSVEDANECPMKDNIIYETSNPYQTDQNCMKENDIYQSADQSGVKVAEGHMSNNQLSHSFDLMHTDQNSIDGTAQGQTEQLTTHL